MQHCSWLQADAFSPLQRCQSYPHVESKEKAVKHDLAGKPPWLCRLPHYCPVCAYQDWNLDGLVDMIWDYLKLLRIYTKPKVLLLSPAWWSVCHKAGAASVDASAALRCQAALSDAICTVRWWCGCSEATDEPDNLYMGTSMLS